MRKILMLVLVALLAAFVGAADETDDGNADLAYQNLVGSVQGPILTLSNVGTAPKDIGGAKVIVREEILGTVPYTMLLMPNPYHFVPGDGLGTWQIIVPLSRPVQAGEKWRLTNGVGIYAEGVA
jgi:hypothetical protein